jgi:rhodanese-related sulfurtransferase
MSTSEILSPPTPQHTMREILAAWPGARRALFARYHIGGCSSCAYDLGQSLAEVCQHHENLPVDEVISHIVTSHENDLRLQISPTELAQLMAEAIDEDITLTLIDVRTREEHEAVSIPGSQLWTEDLRREAFGTWDKSLPVYLYDHQGTQALDAAAFFVGHGFSHVRALAGGIDRFSAEIDPSLPRYTLELE